MFTLRPELVAFTRACEHLLSDGVPLTEDERNLLDTTSTMWCANSSQTSPLSAILRRLLRQCKEKFPIYNYSRSEV